MLPKRQASALRIAILHQGGPTPAINGVVKPFKPGGYIDSGADLAFNLREAGQDVVTPVPNPQPDRDQDWSFPDTVAGIRSAVRDHGANVLWANTTLYAQHPIVQLASELRDVRMVGQSPLDTEKFEDKQWTNAWLASHQQLAGSFPRSLLFQQGDDREALLAFPLPAVAKPIRGRGSHGVTMVTTPEEMNQAATNLLSESDAFLVEEYLDGEEVTIAVMPPGEYSGVGKKTDYWCLPVVRRFNHINGIAPYNGVVAVTANSRVVTQAEHDADPAYQEAQERCQDVARLCKTTAPIRIDARRRSADGGQIVLFDVNMKPNATGPGRPGRDEQASLVTLAAEAIGWDYRSLIVNIVKQAKPIRDVLKQV